MKKILNPLAIVLSFLIFVGLFILLRETFFFHDEWSFLYTIVNSPSRFLLEQHNGHFMPIFNLIYLFEYKIFGLNYYPYQFILLALHFLNGYLLYKIVKQLTEKKGLAILSFFLFILNSIYWEILFSSSSALQYILYLNFTALAIFLFLKYEGNSKQKYLFFSGMFSLLSTYTLGSGVFFSLLFLITIIIKGVWLKKVRIMEVVVFGIAGAISIFTYFKFASVPSASNLDFRQISLFALTSVKWLIVSFYTSSPGFMNLFLILIVFFGVIIFQTLRDSNRRNKFFRSVGKNKFWLCFSALNILYVYFLTAMARYRMDMALAKSSRYTYSTLFFFVFINAVILGAFLPLLSRKVKIILLGYSILLAMGHLCFFRLYYRNWTETISGPNKKIFEQVIKASSVEELSRITLPSTFHPFFTAKEIYLIYQKTPRKPAETAKPVMD